MTSQPLSIQTSKNHGECHTLRAEDFEVSGLRSLSRENAAQCADDETP